MMLSLAVILKPIAALFVYAVVRYAAHKLKPHIPQKWHARLYTPFTEIALEGQMKARDYRQSKDSRILDQD